MDSAVNVVETVTSKDTAGRSVKSVKTVVAGSGVYM